MSQNTVVIAGTNWPALSSCAQFVVTVLLAIHLPLERMIPNRLWSQKLKWRRIGWDLKPFYSSTFQFFPQQMASFSHLTSMMKVVSYSPMGHPLVFMVANSSHTINKSDFGSTGKWVNVICQWFLSLNDTYMEDRSFRIQRCLVWIMEGTSKKTARV